MSSLYGADALYSTDGGQSWGGNVQGAGGTNRGDPAAVIGRNGWFYVGYIAANSGQGVAHSTDGGATWENVVTATSNNALTDISILPKDDWGIREGWACSTTRLWHMATTTATRVFGSTRYETADEICEDTLPGGGLSKVAVLATGGNFADALSAAGLCGLYDAPLLLVSDTLGPASGDLDELNIDTVYIVGGYGAVPESIDDELQDDYGITPTRFAGSDRYETAALVAEEIPDARTSRGLRPPTSDRDSP